MRSTRAWNSAWCMVPLLFLAACNGGDAGSGSGEGDGESTAMRLALHWTYPVAEWSGIILADERGYYEDAGINLELQFLGGSNDTIQAVGGGESDLALAAPDSILAGLAAGIDATVVANHLQVTSSGVIIPAEDGVEDAAELAGYSISTAAASPERAMLAATLNQAGIGIDDVELTYVDAQAKCTVLLTGGADACTGQLNHHPIQLAGEGMDTTFLSFSSPENPVIGHSIFADNSYLEENPEVIEAFLEATMRGYEEAHEDPDAVVDTYVEVHPETNPDFLYETLIASHSLVYSDRTDEHGWGWMDDDAWGNLYEALYDAGVIEQEIDVAEIYTNDHLPFDPWYPEPQD